MLPKVYTDASCTTTSTTIGIYSKDLKISISKTFDIVSKPHTAEELAYCYAKRIVDVEADYHMDNQTVANRLGIIWIPRQQNKKADALTRSFTPFDVAYFIQQNYSLRLKLALVSKVFNLPPVTEKTVHLLDYQSKRFLTTILTSKEKPKWLKTYLSNALPISNHSLNKKLKTIKKD